MNLSNFTIKAQEAITQAQQVAFNNGNPNIETEHMLRALLNDENSSIEFLLKKNNVNLKFLEAKLDESISRLPKVSGTDPAQSISRDANNAILRASNNLKKFGDEFITPEHLLLSIVQGSDNTAKLLKVF